MLPRLASAGGVAILGPTYSEHAGAWRAAGFAVSEIASPGGRPEGARHLVIVNPNNPDGRVLPVDAILDAADLCEARGGVLVVDESFADLEPEASVIGRAGTRPVVVLRSFGKFYGLAGLRLGFAVAPLDLAERLEGLLGPWAVSGPAIAVGTSALADAGWAEAMRGRLAREAAALDRMLVEAGLAVLGGTSLYRLARHPHAARLHESLAAEHIWTRRFDWACDLLRFGLPPDEASLGRLADALRGAGQKAGQLHGTSTG
jgi:cobalamin biosynthetic protein CobC